MKLKVTAGEQIHGSVGNESVGYDGHARIADGLVSALKLGHVYENMMINLRPSNIKLRDRMIRILVEITALSYDEAERLLEENGFSLKAALNAFEK